MEFISTLSLHNQGNQILKCVCILVELRGTHSYLLTYIKPQLVFIYANKIIINTGQLCAFIDITSPHGILRIKKTSINSKKFLIGNLPKQYYLNLLENLTVPRPFTEKAKQKIPHKSLMCGLQAIAQQRGFILCGTQRVAATDSPCHQKKKPYKRKKKDTTQHRQKGPQYNQRIQG